MNDCLHFLNINRITRGQCGAHDGRGAAGSGFVESDVLVDVWGSSAILIDRVAAG